MALVPKLERGDSHECSFAFRASAQSWSSDKTKREIRELSLHRGDVSIVSRAANPAATAALRSEDLNMEQREAIVKRVADRVSGPAYGSRPPLGSREIETSTAARPLIRSTVPEARARKARLARRVSRRSELPVASYLGIARAKARKSRVESQSLDRRYPTQKRGLTLSPFGVDWEIGSATKVHDAVVAVQVGHAAGPDEDAIRAWI